MAERQMVAGATRGMTDGATSDPAPVVEVEDLHVVFRSKRRLFGHRTEVHAVNGVTFSIGRGETLGLVGESGSGKSTTGRALTRLIEPDSGTVRLKGEDITRVPHRQLRPLRRHMQVVFQNPYSSLDPSMVVADSIGEPLFVHEGLSGKARDARVRELLHQVGLADHHLQRYPYEFSGGQRQRVAIARAISVNPSLVVLDEAVSALDVSTQHQIIELMEQLREDLGLAYLFIAHDLAVVRHISHRVAVMYLGHLVDVGPRNRIFASPAHPYTESLLSAVPVPDPVRQRERRRIVLAGDLPDPTNMPTGCPFHTRCPYVMDICRQEMPAMTPVEGGGEVACHLHTTGPVLAGRSVREAPLPEGAGEGYEPRRGT